MSVTVRVPTILRQYTGGAAEVSVEGATLAEVLAALERAPGHRRRASSTTRASCGASSTCTSTTTTCASPTGLATATPDGSSVSIIPAVAGG